MAYLSPQSEFSPQAYSAKVIGIAADLTQHDSAPHQHQVHQLLYAPSGSMTITLAQQWLILPPTRAAWIPAGVEHRVQLHSVVAYRSLYIKANAPLMLPTGVITVNPLLREIIERIAFWPLDIDDSQPPIQHLIAVLFDELRLAPQENRHLIMPTDKRLQRFVQEITHLDNLPSLQSLADQLYLHSKTLSRIFRKETGLAYQQWSQQWRLMRAFELLSSHTSVSLVAQQLGFSSDSAFISFFKQYTGQTPGKFLQAMVAPKLER